MWIVGMCLYRNLLHSLFSVAFTSFWKLALSNGIITSFLKSSHLLRSTVIKTKNLKVDNSCSSLNSVQCLWNSTEIFFQVKGILSYKMKETVSSVFHVFTYDSYAKKKIKLLFNTLVHLCWESRVLILLTAWAISRTK